MSRLIYTTCVIGLSQLIAFILLMIGYARFGETETTMGIAYMWFYSLPAIIVFGLISGYLSRDLFTRFTAVHRQVVWLLLASCLPVAAGVYATLAVMPWLL